VARADVVLVLEGGRIIERIGSAMYAEERMKP
jgi:hypothetical protein